jgi:hypothetical protein
MVTFGPEKIGAWKPWLAKSSGTGQKFGLARPVDARSVTFGISHRVAAVSCLICLMCGGRHAFASPIYSSYVGIEATSQIQGFGGFGLIPGVVIDDQNLPYPQSAQLADFGMDDIGNRANVKATATIWRGGFGIEALAAATSGPFDPQVLDPHAYNVFAVASALGGITLDNLLLLGPATDDPIFVAPAISLDGTMTGSGANYYGVIDAGYQFSSSSGGYTFGTGNVTFNTGDQTLVSASGFLANALDSNSTSVHAGDFIPPILARPGDTLSLSFGATAEARATSGLGEGTGFFDVDFAHTFTLNYSAPIFDLPPGYTVNSDDGVIVDNHFANQTPEPSTFVIVTSAVLVQLGVGTLHSRLRRRGNRVSA